ncbi:sodium channel protein [Elysia marginata]|uniref:Sodium channel protein n=1 Tax=Elysia marginata TaxID=1093978 RepID=A0AAV4FDI9_9GAST|nr:sodium channel protein [Elysia marginata]
MSTTGKTSVTEEKVDPLPLATFKAFTKQSMVRLEEREKELDEKDIQRQKQAQVAHLVDGELKFGVDEDEDKLPPENPDLREGCVFTKVYGAFPPRLLGKPIEEIDRGIRDKTFVVIAPRMGKRYIYRFSATNSLYLLTPWSCLRGAMLRIATHQLFDLFIFLTIIVNCVFLALPTVSFVEKVEYLFLAIYTLECIIKVLARGFMIDKHTYLRDPWNWLDFVVILTAFATIIVQLANPDITVGNLQGLRTFRVLRALKTVSIVPGLRTIVNALLRAFKMLFEVILLTMFCLMVFAMFGLQVYMGVLRQKCVQNVTGYVSNPSQSEDHYYAEWIRDPAHWYSSDGEYVICGNSTGSGDCPDGYFCLGDVGENPRYGYLNFDHFGWSLLTCFQLITLDFWEDIYNKVIRATGPWNVIYFLIVIFFGSFYLINLMLAVVSMSYEEEAVSAGKEKEREKKENARSKHNAMYDMSVIQMQIKRAAAKNSSNNASLDEGENGDAKSMQVEEIKDADLNMNSSLQPVPPATGNESGIESQDGSDKKTLSAQALIRSKMDLLPKSGFKRVDQCPRGPKNQGKVMIIKADTLLDPEIGALEGQVIDRNCDCCERWMFSYVDFLKLQNHFYEFVSSPLFDLFITFCIIMNTFFLSLEHHDQPASLTTTLEISNYIFTAVFIAEAVCKIMGLGKYYFKVGWNIFDLIIVVASILDLGLEQIDGLSVLRTFRLLRVFKLAQSWPTMRLLLTIIVSTLGALGNLCLILVIVIYIFAVIGLQLFRESYVESNFGDDGVPRWNFTDFYHSMLMIFRVLCGEWIEPLYDCMRASHETCMVVFLPALVFGNFIVLNLFLALLLNAFASDSLDKQRETSVERSKLMEGFERLYQLLCCCLPRNRGKVEPSDANYNAASDDVENVDPPIKATTVQGKDNAVKSEGATSKATGEEKTANGVKKPPQIQEADKNKNSKEDVFETKTRRLQFQSFKTAIESSSKDQKEQKEAQKKAGATGSNKSLKSPGASRKPKDKTNSPNKTAEDSNENKPEDKEDANTNNSIDDNRKLKHHSQNYMNEDEDQSDSDAENESTELPNCFPDMIRNRLPCLTAYNESSFGAGFTRVRQSVKKLVDHKAFESIVLIVILGSSLSLAFEDIYLYQKPDFERALHYCNILFAALFALEMVLKWIGLGLKEYFTNFWTVLDFFIVCVSVLSLIGESTGLSNITAFRSLRTLRALRPLRAISRWQGMKIVVNALMNAIPAIVNVFLVCMVFWLIFSIMGVQFFKGKFYKCKNQTTEEVFEYTVVPDRNTCTTVGGSWENDNVNFDNSLIGFLALFQVATFEGWMEIMAAAVDSTNIDQQPRFENTLAAYIYFIIFIVFGSFFSLNLFIGVIIDNFNVLKKRYEGSYLDAFLTTSQRNYFNTLKKLGKKKPQKTIKRPRYKFQLFFYNLAMSNKFELAIVLLIFCNMIVMAIDHYNQTDAVAEALEMMNIIFTTVFLLEAIVKIIGLRYHYFRFLWNIFDFIILIMSILGIILNDILSNLFVTPTLLRVIRVFRIGRVLRLIKAAKGIRKLLFALIISLPAIFNIGALLFLVMYMFAIIGMSSFGNLKINGVMDEIVNFQTFGNSFMLLLRLATSAGWNDVLDALLIKSPYCNETHYTQPDGIQKPSSTGDCGIPYLAIPFMVMYIVIVWLIVINMYIAVILENFNQAHEQEELGITEDDFEMFYVVWEKYDPHATQFIKYEQLADFVADLEQPLQLPKPNEIALVSFNIPIMEGEKMHCLDILIALVKNVLSDVEETEEVQALKDQMEEKFAQNFPSRVNICVKSSTMQRKKEDVAARTLQRSWRSYKAQKAMRNITALAVQQKIRRASSVGLRTRTDVMRSLGARLSNALTNFFNSRKEYSRSPFSSQLNMTEAVLSKQSKIGRQMRVPDVFTLYPPNSPSRASDVDI